MKQTFSKDEKIFNTANVIFMVFFFSHHCVATMEYRRLIFQ